MTPDIEVDQIYRANIECGATAGELRAALNDPRIPDAAEIVDIHPGLVEEVVGEWTVQTLTEGSPLTETREVLHVLLEWS